MESYFDLILQKIDTWFKELILILPNLLISVFFALLGIWFAKRIRKLTTKFLDAYSERKILNNLVVNFIYIATLSLVGFTVLSILNLDRAVTSILAGIGVLSLGLAFAFQDLASNLMSGIIISFRRPINVGDHVDIQDISGIVSEVNLRDTVIHTLQGKKVILPNKRLIETPVTNHTANKYQRLELEVGVAYDSPLEHVITITTQSCQNIKERDISREIEFYYTKFDDSSINFIVMIWLNAPDRPTFMRARSTAIIQIKKAFDQHHINIPFPIRTLYYADKS